VPNFWYRRGKVRYEFRDDNGRMRSLVTIPKAVQAEMHANHDHLTDRMAMADIGAVLRFLDGEPARKGPKGTVGYCLGGRLSLAAAVEFPDQFHASASMHGTRLVSDQPDSPHRSIDKMRGEIYCGFAEHDVLAPPSTIETLGKLFKDASNVRYRYNVHSGTEHGYALPDRDIYAKVAANRDWENIFAMFRRQLA
jgi:carboxymethylenebutenolidase